MATSFSAEAGLRAEPETTPRARGVARSCIPYAGETARSRVRTADGQDYIVTTVKDVRAGKGYLTGAYPLSRGYLVMMRQPLCEFHSVDEQAASERHTQLATVLAEAGVRIVRARASLAARRRAETSEAKATRVTSLWEDETLSVVLGDPRMSELTSGVSPQ